MNEEFISVIIAY